MKTRREVIVQTLAAAAVFPVLGQPSALDLQLLTRVVDLIIPRTDTPGASDAGVPLYIDALAARYPALAREIQSALAALREAKFLDLPEDRQTALLLESPALNTLKDLTIGGYYGSREGLVAELGWHGNTYLAEFLGCTHPEHQGSGDAG
jgi:Gluconate 2-dehydrogenase subunit 3